MEKGSGPNQVSGSIFVETHNGAEGRTPHIFGVSLEDFKRLHPPLGLKLSDKAIKEISATWNRRERPCKVQQQVSCGKLVDGKLDRINKLLAKTVDSERHMINKELIPYRREIEETWNAMEREKESTYFHATLLKIGEFKFEPRHEGELVVKIYYAERKLGWEILDKSKSTKHKVEVAWENILGLRAVIQHNMPGILEIELENEPLFYKEINPTPQSHTTCELSKDFTESQASTYRRHYLEFPSGVLDKYYEKMLENDRRLLEMSKLPYPTLKSPYFGSNSLYIS